MANLFLLVEDMSWFDSHCHLQSFLKKGELEDIFLRASDAEVSQMLTVGTSPEDWADYQILARSYPGQIIYSAGLHPGYVEADWAMKIEGLQGFWSGQNSPAALGEIGLDFFHLPKDKLDAANTIQWQKEAFRQQLQLASELNCPLIIHSRSAFNECVEEIDRSGVDWAKVVFHCFTEGEQEIRTLLERGGRASFTGILTFPKSLALREAAKCQSLDRWMIETDSPYLAPVPLRGKRNEPSYLSHIGKFAAQLLGMPEEEFMEITYLNTQKFFSEEKNNQRSQE